MLHRVVLASIVALLISSAPASLAAGGRSWTVTTLSMYGADEDGCALAINAAGQAVGYSGAAFGGDRHALLWDEGVITNLGAVAGRPWNVAQDINNRGQIVGYGAEIGGSAARAFLWQDGTMTDLGTLGGRQSWAYAINDRGQIVGVAETASHGKHPFLWEDGVMTDLTNTYGAANGINGRGQIVGLDGFRAWLLDRGTLIDLGTLPGFAVSSATDINQRGHVIGQLLEYPIAKHPFIWRGGTMTDLGTLGGPLSWATPMAINNRDQVVGFGYVSQVESHAFIWQDGEMIDLGAAGATSEADGINEGSRIVGCVRSPGHSERHPVIWQP